MERAVSKVNAGRFPNGDNTSHAANPPASRTTPVTRLTLVVDHLPLLTAKAITGAAANACRVLSSARRLASAVGFTSPTCSRQRITSSSCISFMPLHLAVTASWPPVGGEFATVQSPYGKCLALD